MAKTCWDCKAYQANGLTWGTCRLHPPVWTPVPDKQGEPEWPWDGTGQWCWPVVEPSDWCSEWEYAGRVKREKTE